MSERDRIRLQQVEEATSKQTKEATHQPEASHATPAPQGPAQAILQLQRTHGNRVVRRMLNQRIQRSTLVDGGPLSADISDEINRKRGAGQTLDSKVQAEMSSTMGHDFSDVSVHTDSHSDRLNKQLGAKAFTTGKDVFFSQGSYQPDSTDGKKLLAHELTHVIHQDGSSPSGDLTLGPAEDSYESHADQVAEQVSTTAPAVQAQTSLQRQAPEEEEELQMKRDPDLQRQEEEEELRMKRDADLPRQEEEEEL
ncbi:MAG: DUF4157 domain-containing protein, partial [Chloroflexi bacterium]|nr:DUF4157 domain-containing protein [Chloroflexota bacterium]